MNKTIEGVANILMLFGFICIFSGIWFSGWIIIRLEITGILLVIWGYGVSEGNKVKK